MSESMYTTLHSDIGAAFFGPGRHHPEPIDWCEHLPTPWRARVVEPVTIDHHRDYEAAASRALGRDAAGRLCYCAHVYARFEIWSSDGEEFCTELDYGESLRAWRLIDSRWLIYQVTAGSECPVPRSVFRIGDGPPR